VTTAHQTKIFSPTNRSRQSNNLSERSFLFLLKKGVRLKTLGASFCPIFVGSTAAMHRGKFHLFSFGAVILSAVLIQIGTNLANDYYDFLKGADTKERVGPIRIANSSNLFQLKQLFLSLWVIALIPGFYLFVRGGEAIVCIGVLSIACGWLYTAGPFALAYNGLGEIFVLVFFGPVAVMGTYFVQTLTIDFALFYGGLGCGFISSAMLAIANWRDYEEDKQTGKNTLCVCYGVLFAKIEISFFYGAAFFCFAVQSFYLDFNSWIFAVILFLLLSACSIIQNVWRAQSRQDRAMLLKPSGLLLWFFGPLFFCLSLL